MGLIVLLYSFGIMLALVGLWWSSDKAVEYSIQLSETFGLTTFFIGFVLIAISTGIPELAIAIASLWDKVPGIATGAIIGSNLGDVSLVLGLPAIILGTMNVKKKDKQPLMLMLVITAVVMGFVFIVGKIGRLYGIVLLLLYFASIWWLWNTKATKIVSKEEAIEELKSDEPVKKASKIKIVLKLFGSGFLVILFSKVSIDSAVHIVQYLPMKLEAIGATIFAIGTSLPELALSFQAVRKKEYSLAFGNSFGSVLEQATLILGILALGSDKPLDVTMLRPVAPLMFLSYAIVARSLVKKTRVGSQEGLGRTEGILLVALFLIHLVYYFYAK